MSLPLTDLSCRAFSLDSGDYLGLLKVATPAVDTDVVDARGMERYAYNLVTKIGQKLSYTVEMLGAASIPATNLDISLWNIGGTAFLGVFRSGSISVTNATKEASSAAGKFKIPVFVGGTDVEIQSDLMVFTIAVLNTLIAGTISSFSVTALLAYGGQTFSAPMVMTAGSMKIERGEVSMENVTMKLQGTPTSPADSSLLGIALLGSGAIGFALDTGGSTYETGGGQVALMTRFSTRFADAAVIEMEGELMVQGAMTVAGA